MELSPDPWISALRKSHDLLRAHVQPMDATAVQSPSYASEWSIAQVLSHLGSGAEIFGLFLASGLRGEDPPGRTRSARSGRAGTSARRRHRRPTAWPPTRSCSTSIEALDAGQRASLRLNLFGMDMDLTGLVGMRLNEHRRAHLGRDRAGRARPRRWPPTPPR